VAGGVTLSMVCAQGTVFIALKIAQ